MLQELEMAKSPAITTEAVLEYIDAASFEDIAAIKQAASDKIESTKHLVKQQLAEDLKAKLALYQFTPEELGLFPSLPVSRGPRKAAGGESGKGRSTDPNKPCAVCGFATAPRNHDKRWHRGGKPPMDDEMLRELGLTKVEPVDA